MHALKALVAAAALLWVACASPTAPQVPSGAIQITGTVRYFPLEGGFWAVRGDDGVIYDPMHGIDNTFQRENLRVTVVAKVRNDVGGIHMVGPIIEVISIEAR